MDSSIVEKSWHRYEDAPVVPALESPERAVLIESIRDAIQSEISFDHNDPMFSYGDRSVAEKKADAEQIEFRLQQKADTAMEQLQDFDTATLQIIWSKLSGTKRMFPVLSRPSITELELREGLHYSTLVAPASPVMPQSERLAAIRESMDVEDLSVYSTGSAEYRAVVAALELAADDVRRRRMESEINQINATYQSRNRSSSARWGTQLPIPQVEVPPALIDTLLSFPDKRLEINEYLDSRRLTLKKADYGHLKEHLANAAPALGDGIL